MRGKAKLWRRRRGSKSRSACALDDKLAADVSGAFREPVDLDNRPRSSLCEAGRRRGAHIDLTSLALKPGHFVDENLEDRQSDILYPARIAGREGLMSDLRQWKQLMAVVLPERDGTRALTAMLKYIVRTNPKVKRDTLRGLLPPERSSEKSEIEEAVMNWFEQEVEQGRRDGELRGELRGERKLLLKLLRLRFGELPAAVVARIEAADLPDLETWAERVVTVSRLDEVLGAT